MPKLRDIPQRPKLASKEPTMAVPPKQQPMPPSNHHPQPPSMPSTGARGPNVSQQDDFLEMISGPVITVQVGSQSFTLPMKLLARFSAFFRNEIMRLASSTNKKRKRTPESEDQAEKAMKVEEKETENDKIMETEQPKHTGGVGDVTMTDSAGEKEPKTSKVSDDPMKTAHHDAAETLLSIKEEEKLQDPEPEPPRPTVTFVTHTIDCSDIDPSIFGLFLKYIYTGFYPVQVNARPQPLPHMTGHMPHPKSAPQSQPAASSLHMGSPYTQPVPYTIPFEDLSKEEKAHHMLAILTAPKDKNGFPTSAVSAAPPTPRPTPPAATASAQGLGVGNQFIAPSIHAYLLAHRLGSPAFMNHTIHHIYHAIGRDFPLTPWLVDWVWRRTAGVVQFYKKGTGTASPSHGPTTLPGTTPPTAPLSTSAPSQAPPTISTTPINGTGNGSESRLSSMPSIYPPCPLRKLILDILIQHWSSTSTHIVARNQGVNWNKVFDIHGELRHEFMMGLQGGVKVGVVEGYYVRARA